MVHGVEELGVDVLAGTCVRWLGENDIYCIGMLAMRGYVSEICRKRHA